MSPTDRDPAERARRIQWIVDECIHRCEAGGTVSYEEVMAAYPDLMPELGDELHKLALIERARRRAHEANDGQ